MNGAEMGVLGMLGLIYATSVMLALWAIFR